jgi:membrane protein
MKSRMSNPAPTIYVTEPGLASRVGWLFRRAAIAAYEDNCFGVAKGAAYSALLSFFPVLTALTALLVQANAVAVARVISRVLFEVAPPGTQALLENFLVVQGKRPGALLVTAVLLSIWAASGAMMSLMEGFRAAYRIPTGRPFLKQRAIAAALVVCAAAPLVGGSTLIVFGSRTEGVIVAWLGFSPQASELAGWVVLLSLVIRYTLAFSSIVLAAALLYKIAPNRKMRFREVWPGAFVATALWGAATLGFAWYVRNIANYNVLYKSIGAVIALLVWMYVLAVVALFGCEFNVAVQYLRHVRERARVIKAA